MAVEMGARRAARAVGRDAETARLRAAVDAARRGSSACAVVVGEAGVGKTRLLTEAGTAARTTGLAVLVGRAAIASPAPFGVIAEALRGWQREHPTRAEATPFDRGLRLVLPEWSDVGEEPELSWPQLRLLAFEGVVQLIRDIAVERGGAVVVLDDLHAADPESVETARYLATAAVEGVTVLVGLRPREGTVTDEVVGVLGSAGVAEVIELEPLAEDAVTELVATLATAPPPPDFVTEVMARTDGVPLLVEEVLAAHLRAGSVGVAEGVMVWRGDGVAVPRTVRDMVSARLDRLDEEHRAVLRAAAVLGDFAAGGLREVSGCADVDRAVEAGARVGLLDVSGPVAFRHAIIRDAVVDALGPQAREDLHRRAAAHLATAGDDDASVLERRAHHHDALDELDAAAALRTAAARSRLRDHALLDAERLARAALAGALAGDVRSSAADALAEALVAQGRWTEAVDVDAATNAAYGETSARRVRMAAAAVEAGRPDDAAALVARAVAEGDMTPALHVVSGRIAMVRGDADGALASSAVVLDNDADIDVRLAALDLRGRACDFLGRRDEAETAWSTLASLADSHGRTQAHLRAVVQLGKLDLFAGRGLERLHAAVELARAAGAFVELAWAEENLVVGLTLHGEIAEARQLVDEAIERARRYRLDQLAYLLASRGMVETFLGGDALPWLDAAEAALPTDDLRLHTASGRADIAMRDGRYADASYWFGRCRDIMATMPGIVPMDAPCWLVFTLTAEGRIEEAREVLADTRGMPDLERWHTRPLLLDVAEALLDGDVAKVDSIIDSEKDRLWAMDVGGIRLVGADIVTGPTRVAWLREALTAYDSVGLLETTTRIRRLLREAGAPVPRKRRSEPDVPGDLAARGVTTREAEVLRLVGEGLSNAEIAERLVVSVRTVESHVSSLLAKLGVDRRARLVARHGV